MFINYQRYRQTPQITQSGLQLPMLWYSLMYLWLSLTRHPIYKSSVNQLSFVNRKHSPFILHLFNFNIQGFLKLLTHLSAVTAEVSPLETTITAFAFMASKLFASPSLCIRSQKPASRKWSRCHLFLNWDTTHACIFFKKGDKQKESMMFLQDFYLLDGLSSRVLSSWSWNLGEVS